MMDTCSQELEAEAGTFAEPQDMKCRANKPRPFIAKIEQSRSNRQSKSLWQGSLPGRFPTGRRGEIPHGLGMKPSEELPRKQRRQSTTGFLNHPPKPSPVTVRSQHLFNPSLLLSELAMMMNRTRGKIRPPRRVSCTVLLLDLWYG